MQDQEISSFDMVLVLDYFRSAGPYLSIIKYLGKDFSIGVYQTSLDRHLVNKTGKAQDQFLGECQRLGAALIGGGPVSADVMVVQQRPYAEEMVAKVLHHIRARRRVALMTLAMSGIDTHDKFLLQFDIQRIYIPNRRFFNFLLEKRGAQSIYAGVEVEQVGLPYARYPLVSEFQTDYLVAVPTQFSFPDERAKQRFLEAVLKLFDQIGADEQVVYKPHNGMRHDSLAPRVYTQIGVFLNLMPFGDSILNVINSHAPEILLPHLERIKTGLLYSRMIRRVTPLADLTSYANFQLEIFLPEVRKGVIGGLSNTIWGTLYFGLPFYNCSDRDWRERYKGASQMSGKNADNLLDLNLQFFGVPCCDGDLSLGERGNSIIDERDRQGELIEALRFDMDAARTAEL